MGDIKVAVVTGASSGMGAACARAFAERGYQVAVMARSERVLALAKEIGALALRGSVTEARDIDALVGATMAAHGRIDAVVNSTGHPARGPLLDLSDADWHAGLDLMLLNVVRMARSVTPIMRAQGGGAIVNISTYAAVEPSPDYPISASLRAGLAGFVKLYADAHAPDGIRINNILPGFIASFTPKPEIARTIPMRRYGSVAEIAETALFLCSAGAGYITGQNIRVDGGLSRSV